MDTTHLHHITQQLLQLKSEKIAPEDRGGIVDDLIAVIKQHNHLYHIMDAPVISDVQYDQLFSLLQEIENNFPEHIHPDSPTQKMSIDILNAFEKKDHGGVHLLSLKNSYNASDLQDRDQFLKRQLGEQEYTFLIEPKFDGASVQLVYEYGRLTQGITRGNGRVGQDITQHVQLVANLPNFLEEAKEIPTIRLRAEIVMPKTSLDKLNAYQLEEGLPVFSNTRNATSGTLRQLDPMAVADRGLAVFIHELLYRDHETTYMTYSDIVEILKGRGLPFYTTSFQATHIDEVIEICERESLQKELLEQNIEFDGLVVKVDELTVRDLLGATDHHPRRAMAYKFPAQQIATKLLDITYQIGRTGVITPVAELEPVQLSGATLSRATLHNFDYIQKYDIRHGDYVWIQRSGEVIPYVLGPVVAQRTGEEQVIMPPTHCPCCGSKLERDEAQVALCCPSDSCESKIKAQLKHAVSKGSLNIEGLGDKLIDALVERGFVTGLVDIFTLTSSDMRMQLRSLPGVAEKKLDQLGREIEQAKTGPLWRLLHALGINFVGKKIARLLETYVEETLGEGEYRPSVLADVLRNEEDLLSLFGIGPQSVASLVTYFSDRRTLDMLEQLGSLGVSIRVGTTNSKPIATGVLSGKKIVITGRFDLSRNELISIVEAHGGVVTGSVSGSTDFLLAGDASGSKLEKAKALDVQVYTLQEAGELFGITFEATEQKTGSAPVGATQQSLFG